MKIFDTIGTTCKKVASKANDKSLALAVGAMSVIGASSANAADVSYTESAGFTGTFNLTPFYSAVAIIVVAIGVVASIRLALTMFKKVA